MKIYIVSHFDNDDEYGCCENICLIQATSRKQAIQKYKKEFCQKLMKYNDNEITITLVKFNNNNAYFLGNHLD